MKGSGAPPCAQKRPGVCRAECLYFPRAALRRAALFFLRDALDREQRPSLRVGGHGHADALLEGGVGVLRHEGVPALEQHLVIVHVVAERGTFPAREAEAAPQKAQRRALVRPFFGDIQPIPAREDDAQVRQRLRQHAHASLFGAAPVVHGDLAHVLAQCHLAEVPARVVHIGRLHVLYEGLRFVLVVGAVRRAEEGVRLRQPFERAQGALHGGAGQRLAAEHLAAAGDDGAVFRDDGDLVPYGREHPLQRGQLPPARGAEQDPLIMQFEDGAECPFGQLPLRGEQRAVEVARDESDHCLSSVTWVGALTSGGRRCAGWRGKRGAESCP